MQYGQDFLHTMETRSLCNKDKTCRTPPLWNASWNRAKPWSPGVDPTSRSFISLKKLNLHQNIRHGQQINNNGRSNGESATAGSFQSQPYPLTLYEHLKSFYIILRVSNDDMLWVLTRQGGIERDEHAESANVMCTGNWVVLHDSMYSLSCLMSLRGAGYCWFFFWYSWCILLWYPYSFVDESHICLIGNGGWCNISSTP